jgi:hypothetical protein
VLEPWTKIGMDDYVLEGRPSGAAQDVDDNRLSTPFDILRELQSLGTPPTPPRPPTPQQVLAVKQADTARMAAEALRLRSEARLAASVQREAAKEGRVVAAKKARAVQQAAVLAATSGRMPSPLVRPNTPWSAQKNTQQKSSTTEASGKTKKVSLMDKVVAKKGKESAVRTSRRKVAEGNNSKRQAQQAETEKKAVVAASARKTQESKDLKRQVEKEKKAAIAASKSKIEESKEVKPQSEQTQKEKIGQNRLPEDSTLRRCAVVTVPGKQSMKVAQSVTIKESKSKPVPPSKPPPMQSKKVAQSVTIKESKSKPVPPSKPPPMTAFRKALRSQVSRTIALPKKASTSPFIAKVPSSRFTSPKGVPSLMRWKKNRDGSVTGLITGSDQFDENERITTSPILKGIIAPGNLVETKSGSKYFLS